MTNEYFANDSENEIFSDKRNVNNKEDDDFLKYFSEDSEDYFVKKTPEVIREKSLERELEDKIAQLRKEYPMGGLKASRFITSDFLMKAPKDYFDKYEDRVKKAVNGVQNIISTNGQSEITGAAGGQPTNDELQEEAYRVVQSATAEYLTRNDNSMGLDKAIVMNLVCCEIIGFGRLDPLWRDSRIDEILCNGPRDVQVEIGGILRRVPACNFRDRDHMKVLITRLYEAIGKNPSRTTPIVDGRLHDNSRMAVVDDSVAPDGPNFSIRRHKEEYITPQQLIDWGTASPELMTFLGNLIYKQCSILVVGGTSSGKTTLLGALAGFFRPDHRILTLEDNLELKLPKAKLLAAPMECVPARPDNPNSGVSMRDLVKASLRQRPNAIVVGEVRDQAAYDLCQALNTGHYGMSTIHANSEYDAIYRISSLVAQGGMMGGENALPLIAASFDVIVRIDRFPQDGSRKIVSVSEVAPFPARKKDSNELYLPTNVLWEFNATEIQKDTMKVIGHWEQKSMLSETRVRLHRLDLEKDLTWDQLAKII